MEQIEKLLRVALVSCLERIFVQQGFRPILDRRETSVKYRTCGKNLVPILEPYRRVKKYSPLKLPH